MKTQIGRILASLFTIIVADHCAQAQYIYTTLDDPLGVGLSQLLGISGTNIVGLYGDSKNSVHGLFYNGSAWISFDAPGAASGASAGTVPTAIDGYDIVGYFNETNGNTYGFLYNIISSNWTILHDSAAAPGVNGGTYPFGISGAVISGYYVDASGDNHGFIYNIAEGTWTNHLDDPHAASGNGLGTLFGGISGTHISGTYADSSGIPHGFLYNMVSGDWTTLNEPLGAGGTYAEGISGSNIVGDYHDSRGNVHGFLYNMINSNWTVLDDPVAPIGESPSGGTYCFGVSGANIVGSYHDSKGPHGFLATPTPQLAVTQSGNGLTISWSFSPFISWTLQQNPDLTTTNWSPAPTGGISNDGTNNYYMIPPSPGNLFFRLSQQ